VVWKNQNWRLEVKLCGAYIKLCSASREVECNPLVSGRSQRVIAFGMGCVFLVMESISVNWLTAVTYGLIRSQPTCWSFQHVVEISIPSFTLQSMYVAVLFPKRRKNITSWCGCLPEKIPLNSVAAKASRVRNTKWNANLMQQGNFIDIFLARHVSGTYAHHQEH